MIVVRLVSREEVEGVRNDEMTTETGDQRVTEQQ
jgi:hypothetical protein